MVPTLRKARDGGQAGRPWKARRGPRHTRRNPQGWRGVSRGYWSCLSPQDVDEGGVYANDDSERTGESVRLTREQPKAAITKRRVTINSHISRGSHTSETPFLSSTLTIVVSSSIYTFQPLSCPIACPPSVLHLLEGLAKLHLRLHPNTAGTCSSLIRLSTYK